MVRIMKRDWDAEEIALEDLLRRQSKDICIPGSEPQEMNPKRGCRIDAVSFGSGRSRRAGT